MHRLPVNILAKYPYFICVRFFGGWGLKPFIGIILNAFLTFIYFFILNVFVSILHCVGNIDLWPQALFWISFLGSPPKGRFQEKKIVEFSTKRGGVWINRFSTKKNIGSKHWKWPKMHIKTNLFFSILGGGRGSFHHD